MSAAYRKRPIVIEAFQMTRGGRYNKHEWPEWLRKIWAQGDTEAGKVWDGKRLNYHQLIMDYWVVRDSREDISIVHPSDFGLWYEEVDE